jgi:hypothetical protein
MEEPHVRFIRMDRSSKAYQLTSLTLFRLRHSIINLHLCLETSQKTRDARMAGSAASGGAISLLEPSRCV